MQKYAIIVAGGSGSRMDSNIPKQFILLDGLPILMHTINAFKAAGSSISIILVLPASQIDSWEALCKSYQFSIPLTIAEGGHTRFHSVKNGLDSIRSDDGVVAIHDGVRPLITADIINQSFKDAIHHGCSIVCVDSKDSIRMIEGSSNHALDRSKLKIVQTPQSFRISLIKKAFEKEYQSHFTDDASVAEAAGEHIFLTSGDYENIKITTPEDIEIASAILKKRKQGLK